MAAQQESVGAAFVEIAPQLIRLAVDLRMEFFFLGIEFSGNS
jgi:hypothetical protein